MTQKKIRLIWGCCIVILVASIFGFNAPNEVSIAKIFIFGGIGLTAGLVMYITLLKREKFLKQTTPEEKSLDDVLTELSSLTPIELEAASIAINYLEALSKGEQVDREKFLDKATSDAVWNKSRRLMEAFDMIFKARNKTQESK